jgi:hypothetical protein
MDAQVVAFADKTVLRITGLRVRGLRPHDLEQLVTSRLGAPARVIGVTGSAIDLDVYGLDPEAIRRDAAGLITVVATAEGIHVDEVATLARCERAVPVYIDAVPPRGTGCAGERWRR